MKRTSTFVQIAVTGVLAALAAGCAKPVEVTKEQVNNNNASLLVKSLELPLPAGAIASLTSTGAATAGANIQALVTTIISPIAEPLFESKSKLREVVTNGTRSEGNLKIVYTPQSAELTGTRNDGEQKIAWTYNLGSYKPALTASVKFDGSTGDVSYPTLSFSNPTAVTWTTSVSGTTIVRKLTVRSATNGVLDFEITYSGSIDNVTSVKLLPTSKVGTAAVSGEWNSTNGGKFSDTTGTTRCFSTNLADLVPCPGGTFPN